MAPPPMNLLFTLFEITAVPAWKNSISNLVNEDDVNEANVEVLDGSSYDISAHNSVSP
jgi:hypothetical protein